MNRKKEIKEELNEIAPFLSKIDKKESFQLPPNYFEQLPDQIMSQLEMEPNPKTLSNSNTWLDKIIASFAGLLRPRAVMAMTSIALVLGSFFYFNQEKNDLSENIGLDQYLAYVEDNIEDFEEEMIFELSLNDDLEMDVFSDTKIEDQALDSYLDEFIDDLDDRSLEDLL